MYAVGRKLLSFLTSAVCQTDSTEREERSCHGRFWLLRWFDCDFHHQDGHDWVTV